MTDTTVTVASLRSVLIDPERNLELVRGACPRAERDGARLLLCPELQDEIVTLSLSASAREFNRGPTRSRRWGTSLPILEQAFAYRRDRL